MTLDEPVLKEVLQGSGERQHLATSEGKESNVLLNETNSTAMMKSVK